MKRRLLIFGAIVVGLLVAFGVTGEGGFQTAKRAEAVETTTTWMYTNGGAGITVPGNLPAEATVSSPAVCADCYITNIVPDLVYQGDPDHLDGTTANFNNNNSLDGAWLHHMVIIDACNLSPLKRVFASGNERTVWSLPAGYGYHQNCVGGWYVNYHIHNNSSVTRHVALKLVITYRTGETLIPVSGIWLDMSNTGNSEYTVPSDGYSDTHTGSGGTGISSDWTSTIQGKIVGIGGHVHDYGISTAAFNNRLGDYICTSVAGYGTGSRYRPLTGGGPVTPGHPATGNAVALNQSYHEPTSPPDDRYHIQQMTSCTPTPVQAIICVGDVLTLHTQYNNTSLFDIMDAMGIITAEVDTNQPDTNSNGTIDACDDTDGDTVKNIQDNCPLWANTSQAYPPAGLHPTAGDTDCDGFPDSVLVNNKAAESYIGTNPLLHCAATAGANNDPLPDADPMDFNDDRVYSGQDTGKFGGPFGSYGHVVGDGPFGPPGNQIPGIRFDFSGNGVISGQDTGKYQSYYGKACTP